VAQGLKGEATREGSETDVSQCEGKIKAQGVGKKGRSSCHSYPQRKKQNAERWGSENNRASQTRKGKRRRLKRPLEKRPRVSFYSAQKKIWGPNNGGLSPGITTAASKKSIAKRGGEQRASTYRRLLGKREVTLGGDMAKKNPKTT